MSSSISPMRQPSDKQDEAFGRQLIAEQRREITRLQKKLARLQVKSESEVAALKAQLAEARKNKINVTLQASDAGLL